MGITQIERKNKNRPWKVLARMWRSRSSHIMLLGTQCWFPTRMAGLSSCDSLEGLQGLKYLLCCSSQNRSRFAQMATTERFEIIQTYSLSTKRRNKNDFLRIILLCFLPIQSIKLIKNKIKNFFDYHLPV